jgi:hypothetical protein
MMNIYSKFKVIAEVVLKLRAKCILLNTNNLSEKEA